MGTSKLHEDNPIKCWAVTGDELVFHPGEVEILLLQKPEISAGLMGVLARPILIGGRLSPLPFSLTYLDSC